MQPSFKHMNSENVFLITGKTCIFIFLHLVKMASIVGIKLDLIPFMPEDVFKTSVIRMINDTLANKLGIKHDFTTKK